MQFSEWESVYESILVDFGYSRRDDESSARMLKAMTPNFDIVDDDYLAGIVGREATVFGAADSLSHILNSESFSGTLVSAGSATGVVMDAGVLPDIVVTDLDGDIGPQVEANLSGALAVLHAHGDNMDLIMRYVDRFKGPVMLTTQSRPDLLLCNHGGFTDGDRAVCLLRHFGARSIRLAGFDFEHPSAKEDSDPAVKSRKLAWAKRIIFDMNPPYVELQLL